MVITELLRHFNKKDLEILLDFQKAVPNSSRGGVANMWSVYRSRIPLHRLTNGSCIKGWNGAENRNLYMENNPPTADVRLPFYSFAVTRL
jgi:hypothetical protein